MPPAPPLLMGAHTILMEHTVGNPMPMTSGSGMPRPSSASRAGSGGRGEGCSEVAWEAMANEQAEEDAFLRDLAGVESLERATTLRVVVNTSLSTISHLGAKLPQLQELNLTGSVLESLRDLGTALRHLSVLWVSRCGLAGLEGAGALPSLRELYAAYNDIDELQALDSCPSLEVLDLEGNCVADLDGALHTLATGCPLLLELTLAGCPVAGSEGYRAAVAAALPQLQSLDDEPLGGANGSSSDGGGSSVQHQRQQLDASSSGNGAEPGCEASGPGRPGSGGNEQGSTGPAAQELAMVREAIKHARVGVDSHEFRELEMSLMLTPNEVPMLLESAPPGGTSAALMPVAASAWLRCSQQGSLAAMRRSLTSAGGLTAGSDSSTSRPTSANGVAGCNSVGGSRPCSSGQQAAIASASGRPPTNSRPFSARPGTAGIGRPGSASSAPPSASPAGGGLYWKKNRLGSGGHSGTRTSGGKERSAAMDALLTPVGPEDEAASSALTMNGEAAIGGSLAKDLRRRRKVAAAGSLPGSGGPPTLCRSGSGILDGRGPAVPAHHHDSGAGAAAAAAAAAAGQSAAPRSVDTGSLLDELRKWKMETADVVLAAPEDEAMDGMPWCSRTSDDATAQDVLQLSSDSGGSAPAGVGLAGPGPSAVSGMFEPEPSPCSPSFASRLGQGVGGAADRALLLSRGSLQPTTSFGEVHSPGAPLGKPPLAAGSSVGASRSSLGPVRVVGSTRGGKMTLSKVVRETRDAGLSPMRHSNTAGVSSSSAAAAVAAVLQSSPSGRSSMDMVHGGQGGSGRVHRPSSAMSACSSGNLSVAGGSAGEEHGEAGMHLLQPHGSGSGRQRVTCAVGEVDLRAVNPRPVAREDHGGSSDEEDDDDDDLMKL